MAATNEDLEAAIARGTFRADLYHRINSFTLRMPCLRQMRGDIPLFADFFLDQANRELDKRIVGFDAAAAAALAAYDWPGNLRQLKNAVMSATLLAAGEYITCRDLPAEVTGGPAEPAEAPLSLRDPASEEEQIRRALANRRLPACPVPVSGRPFHTPAVEFFHTFCPVSTFFHTFSDF